MCHPGHVMFTRGALPLGLFRSVRTFTLSNQDTMTHLRVQEEFTAPLARLTKPRGKTPGRLLHPLRQSREGTRGTDRLTRQ